MIEKFLGNPLTNSLAVVVLLALIISLIIAILLISRDQPVSAGKNWYTKIQLAFSLTGIFAVLDLLQTNGAALIFALISSFILALNIAILILQILEKTSEALVKNWFKWSIPALVVGGLAVSGYFIFLNLTDSVVMCGPSQGCGPVTSSRFAKINEDISMGEFGFVGYVLILVGWMVQQYGRASVKEFGSLGIWGLCIFGVIFSIYLTFLEPFVIGATCMWCILSAVFMMLLLLNSTPTAQQALRITDE